MSTPNKYQPHQGPREKARRVRQAARRAEKFARVVERLLARDQHAEEEGDEAAP